MYMALKMKFLLKSQLTAENEPCTNVVKFT